MNSVPRLVLDAGGVLYAETFRRSLGELAKLHGGEPEQMIAHYEAQLRPGLWRGGISEDQFWHGVAQALGAGEPDPAWREYVLERFTELPAVDRVAWWSQRAELWILSNHRHEWLRDLLAASHITALFDRILISSEIGAMKPDPEAFRFLTEGDPERLLFVDDKQENLDAAALAGVPGLLADPDGRWHAQVDTWLEL